MSRRWRNRLFAVPPAGLFIGTSSAFTGQGSGGSPGFEARVRSGPSLFKKQFEKG
jgi:hypothetical protein